MPRLRICVVGAGRFCTRRILSQLDQHDVEPVGICDLVEDKAEVAQAKFGFERTYTDFRLMLEKEQPDAVFCIGGADVHYEVGREILAMGFPLYTQKPPCHTAEQARELAQLATDSGVVYHVGFNLRGAPVVLKARELAAAEPFGGARCMIMRYGLAGTPKRRGMLDQHVHGYDLVRFMLGPIRVANVVKSGFEDSVNYIATVESETGAVGTIVCTSGGMMNKEFLFFELTGKEGIIYSHDFYALEYLRAGDPAQTPDHVYRRGMYLMDDLYWLGYFEDVRNFLAAVAGEEPDRSPIADAVNTMEAAEEIVGQVGVE